MAVESKLHLAVSNVFALIGTPTITPAVEPETPEENILDSTRGKIVRITGSPDPVIKGSSATVYSTGCFGLWGHNFDDATTIRVRFWDGINQTGSVVYDSTALDALDIKAWGDMVPGVDPWGDVYSIESPKLFIDYFDDIQFKSYQIDINNVAPLSFLDIGLIYTGVTWVPSTNISWGSALTRVDQSKHSRTAGGGLRTSAQDSYRQLAFDLDWLTEADRDMLSEFLENYGGKANDIMLSLDPTVTTRMKLEGSMICRLVNDASFTRLNFFQRTTPLVFEEI